MRTIFPAGSQGLGDAELISAARTGDAEAYAELADRHTDSAHRLARQLVPEERVDALVADAFAKVQLVLKRGDGPEVAFRPYLLTAVRRLHVDHGPATRRAEAPEDVVAARAFTSLPEPWRMVLWHSEVDGQDHDEIARLLGETPESVPALSSRAREGMRIALLTMHEPTAHEECEWTRHHLGAFVRKVSFDRDTARIERHLASCQPCTAICRELTEGSVNLRSVLAPLVLGSAAAGYLAAAPNRRSAGRARRAARSANRRRARRRADARGPVAGTIAGVLGFFAGIVSGVAGAPSAAAARIGDRFRRTKDFVTDRTAAAAVAGVATLALGAGGVFVVVQAADGPLGASAEPPAGPALDDESAAPPEFQDTTNVDPIGIGGATSAGPGEKQASDEPSDSESPSPSDDPSGSQSASPSDDPSTSDRPSPDPSDPSDPSDPTQEPTHPSQPTRPPSQQPSDPPTQAPTQAPTPPSDLDVSASANDLLGMFWGIDVRVTGLAPGATATLSVYSSSGSASRLTLDSKCSRSGDGGASCRVSDTPSNYHFRAQSLLGGSPTTITFVVSLDAGSDADTSNNSTSVTIRS